MTKAEHVTRCDGADFVKNEIVWCKRMATRIVEPELLRFCDQCYEAWMNARKDKV